MEHSFPLKAGKRSFLLVPDRCRAGPISVAERRAECESRMSRNGVAHRNGLSPAGDHASVVPDLRREQS